MVLELTKIKEIRNRRARLLPHDGFDTADTGGENRGDRNEDELRLILDA